ncbi:MAG: cytochrome c biogenesis protein CcsA [Cyclobacteriaceae bacterium]
MRYFKILFSGSFMGVLLLVFAYAIGYATFIENDYGPISAKLLIYNSRWFEVLLFFMVVNFMGMIFTKRLYRKSKLNILVIHLALVIVVLGAALTRYIGFEGQMHIRTGKTSNVFLSTDTYLQLDAKQGESEISIDEKVMLSPLKSDLIEKTYQLDKKPVRVVLENFYPNAKKVVEASESGEPYISIVVGGRGGRRDYNIKESEYVILPGLGISFGDTIRKQLVQIIRKNGDLQMRMPNAHENPHGPKEGGDKFMPLKLMNLYSYQETSFMITKYEESGSIKYEPSSQGAAGGEEVIRLTVNDQEVFIPRDQAKTISVDGMDVTLKVGYKPLKLPFSIKLKQFELERYPGSSSPSSYASEVVLIDEENGVEMPYRIFMNNILSYGGYRFYQSSYDNDELGTVLSVNHDYWGTLVTYIGYFLLFASLIASFFTRKTRFQKISQRIAEIHQKRKILMTKMLVLAFMVGVSFQSIAQADGDGVVDASHASNFGELLLQNKAGRIEPVNTASGKILVKVFKKSTYNEMTSDQVLLEMMVEPEKWKDLPLIKVDNAILRKQLAINEEYGSFNDFVDKNGVYKIRSLVEKANIKKPSQRSKYDKALINIDERVNVFYLAISGSLLQIFPAENDSTNKWLSPSQFHHLMGHGTEKGDFFEKYVNALKEAKVSGNYSEADQILQNIKAYQNEVGAAVMPSETKTNLEIFYNKAELFKKLFPYYLTIGLIIVILFFLQTFHPAYEFKLFNKILSGAVGLLFLFHTGGLILRWYISGHAPWSNGYESMIYISWATILAGFITKKKSPVIVGLSAVLSGITLLTAHMSWMNPEITNLVPVLKSYWLTFHVATITASYGFLALGCMLGFLNLCIMIFRSKKNLERINLVLEELTLIVEISLIIGLIFLVIGNFLGGIWANESWGRYWGWDPKETWTLVTIILYSFVLHSNLIPRFKNAFTFNFLAMVSFGAVLMTYFGVNYFLSGLHSYAGGDSVEIPVFVNYILIVMLVVSILAVINVMRMERKTVESIKD